MSRAFTSALTTATVVQVHRPAARRPAVAVVVCLMVGIALHQAMPIAPEGFVLLATAMGLAGMLRLRWGRVSSVCLAAALWACGVALGQVETFYYPPGEIGLFASADSSLAELELLVELPPRLWPAKQSRAPDHQQLVCHVLKVRTWTGWRPASGEIGVWVIQAHPALHAGSRFRAIGQLSRPPRGMNPGQFDWADYDRRQRTLASFSIAGPGQITLIGRDPLSLLQWIRLKARRYLDAGFSAGADHDLLRALLLGEGGASLRPIRADFQRTGTAHHLSTSGMHVAVVALIGYGLCRLLCWPPRRSAVIALGVMLLYGAVVVPSPPIVRSILLAGAIGGGILLRCRADGLQLLALAMLAMLIFAPLDLYSAGFQLSFAAVASLMVFTKPLSQWLRPSPDPEFPIPMDHSPGLWRASGRWLGDKSVTILATGLAAWGVCAPLVAWHFRQFNPYALVGGALLEPVVFLSIVAGALKVVLTMLFPWLASQWAMAASLPAEALRLGVAALSRVPGTNLMAAAPSLGWLAAWYVMIALPLLAWPKFTRLKRAGPATACVMGVIFLFRGGPALPSGAMRLTFLSVGAGQCAVAELPNGHAVLFDAGSEADSHLADTCFEPYARLRNIHHIDAIFISHPNLDHFSAVVDIVRRFGAGRIYVTPQFIDEARHNASAEQLLDDLDVLNCRPVILSSGRHISLDPATAVDVIWPNGQTPLHDNEASMVLALTHGRHRILLCGDIQSAAESRLMNDPSSLPSDILIAPHHGSAEPTTARFISLVDPQAIISSNDHTLTKKQRDFEQRIGARALYRTDRCGAVTVMIRPDDQMTIKSFVNDRRP
jgi:competence protein ComEC